jgi:purine-binding chemotaxis protein CheW
MLGESLEVLVFEMAGQRYGLPAADVRELLRAVALTPIPGAPAGVEGAINLRGSIVPVYDLRQYFRLPAKPLELSDHLVVARLGQRPVALRVDQALDLLQIERTAITAEASAPGVAYVARVEGFPRGLVLIRDLAALLTTVGEGVLP